MSVHPQTGAVTIRPGVRYFEDGKVTRRFEKLAEALLEPLRRALPRAGEVTDYLSLEQVLDLHRVQIERFGGSRACATAARVEAALGAAADDLRRRGPLPDVEAKAAALMHSLVDEPPVRGREQARGRRSRPALPEPATT